MSNNYLQSIKERIFRIDSPEEFKRIALEIFRHQSVECKPYRQYIELIGVVASSVNDVMKIPFMPVQFFKSHRIYCVAEEPQKQFTSSATTGMVPSVHYVADLSIYQESFTKMFSMTYGDPSEYAILALLPSYLEREGSSLIYMADSLIRQSGNRHSGYYLYNHNDLYNKLEELRNKGQKTILLGVSFALLDYVEKFTTVFPSLTIIETGGMKGRGTELPREVIHEKLRKGFGVEHIHSEYGMAELLSQAYSRGDGLFTTPPWMKVFIRDLNNPFRLIEDEKLGGINIIDLANAGSCSFIETQDMGIKTAGNLFSIPGRIKGSELRGCNLLLG